MALNLLKLFCDVSTKKLVKSAFDPTPYVLPAFFNNDKVRIELQCLMANDRGGLSAMFKPIEDAFSVELGLADVADSPTERAAVTLTQRYKLWSVDIITAGTDYTVGDTLTIDTTTAVINPEIKVTGADSGNVTSVEILNEGVVTTVGSYSAAGFATSHKTRADASATGLKLRCVFASIHEGVLDLSGSSFDSWLGTSLTKETSFEIRAYSGSDWESTVFQTTATVKADGFQ